MDVVSENEEVNEDVNEEPVEDVAEETSEPEVTEEVVFKPRRILGIDPGLNTAGYAVLEVMGKAVRVVEAGVIRSQQRDSLTEKVRKIYDGVTDAITSLKPTEMAIEQLYSHYDRPQTSILMGHSRGVVCLAASLAEIPVMHYASTQVKKILTGNGRAPKRQMQDAIQRELSLDAPPEPADVADALAIALCHFYLGSKQADIEKASKLVTDRKRTVLE